MITSSGEKDFQAKAEGDTTNSKFNSRAPSSSRQWTAYKNPRIAHVSRAFGGKDRHTKVCTIRGLRDRRIRLSVPTAIQLYDLQDRLDLNRPSKVVEWLLDATKHEIDKLPPLNMPQGSFGHLVSRESNALQSSFSPFFNANSAYLKDGGTRSLLSSKEGIKINYNAGDDQMMGKSKAWESDAIMGAKLKEVERESIVEKTKWMGTNNPQNQDGSGGYIPQAQNFFPIASHFSFPNLLNNAVPYNSYHHWDPSNLSFSKFGSHGFPIQTEGTNSCHWVPLSLPSSSALPSGSQLFLCPPSATPSISAPYPPYFTASAEKDTRQINQFLPNPLMSTFHSISSPMSATSNVFHLPSQNDERQPNKGSTGS